MTEYRWCGLTEQWHAIPICDQMRLQDKKTKEWSRSRCGFLNEAGGCDFMTTEEKAARTKALIEAREEKGENEEKNNGDIDGSPGEGYHKRN